MKRKLKNYGLWLSVASLFYLVAKRKFNMELGEYNTYVDAFLGILVALGIISNPSQGKGYRDKEM